MTDHRFATLLLTAFAAGCYHEPECGALLEYDSVSGTCICRGVFICETADTCVCIHPDGGALDAGVGDAETAPDAATCAESETMCSGACADTTSDETHCGRCDVTCEPFEQCRASRCEDPFVQLAAGNAHVCALRASGGVWCWGFGRGGQLGNGAFDDSLVPVRVSTIDDAVAIAAAATLGPADSSSFTCALRAGGTVWCWGENRYGQLGDGTNIDRALPVQVPGIAGAIAVATESSSACAALADRSVVCWGGSETEVIAPAPLASAVGVADMVGGIALVARDVADRVFVMLGAGDTAMREDWSIVHLARDIAAGASAVCALDGDGAPYCAGTPEAIGVVGGDPVSDPTPVVDAPAGQIAIAAGAEDVCALDGDGVTCWGRRDLQIWARESRIAAAIPPVRVAGTRGAEDVAVGLLFACVLSEGRPACWGTSTHGELGRGATTSSDAPLPVLGLFE